MTMLAFVAGGLMGGWLGAIVGAWLARKKGQYNMIKNMWR